MLKRVFLLSLQNILLLENALVSKSQKNTNQNEISESGSISNGGFEESTQET